MQTTNFSIKFPKLLFKFLLIVMDIDSQEAEIWQYLWRSLVSYLGRRVIRCTYQPSDSVLVFQTAPICVFL